MADKEQHIDADDARAGSTENVVRYVLGVSFVLAVIAMLLVLWI
ncbi:hypothetical protein J3E64_000434 [Sphingobium sp. OAS761]|nr:hypothetical protein [Sphingobium sp. OAS761]MCP1468767.1 hypothetical protein [Sphingobium sp. OAS761]